MSSDQNSVETSEDIVSSEHPMVYEMQSQSVVREKSEELLAKERRMEELLSRLGVGPFREEDRQEFLDLKHNWRSLLQASQPVSEAKLSEPAKNLEPPAKAVESTTEKAAGPEESQQSKEQLVETEVNVIKEPITIVEENVAAEKDEAKEADLIQFVETVPSKDSASQTVTENVKSETKLECELDKAATNDNTDIMSPNCCSNMEHNDSNACLGPILQSESKFNFSYDECTTKNTEDNIESSESGSYQDALEIETVLNVEDLTCLAGSTETVGKLDAAEIVETVKTIETTQTVETAEKVKPLEIVEAQKSDTQMTAPPVKASGPRIGAGGEIVTAGRVKQLVSVFESCAEKKLGEKLPKVASNVQKNLNLKQ